MKKFNDTSEGSWVPNRREQKFIFSHNPQAVYAGSVVKFVVEPDQAHEGMSRVSWHKISGVEPEKLISLGANSFLNPQGLTYEQIEPGMFSEATGIDLVNLSQETIEEFALGYKNLKLLVQDEDISVLKRATASWSHAVYHQLNLECMAQSLNSRHVVNEPEASPSEGAP